MNTKFLWPLIVFVLLVAVFVVGLTKDPSRIPSPLVDNPAPEFSLPSLQDPDVMVGSADYENQVVLVNIWATWCPGCRQEHPFLMELAAEGGPFRITSEGSGLAGASAAADGAVAPWERWFTLNVG